MELKHFTLDEFDSPDIPGSGVKMHPVFLETLDKVREVARIPFFINSGYRTLEHNKEIGGATHSAHLRGLAADIKAEEGFQKYRIIQAALLLGIRRIGIGRNFIHLDMDPELPQNVIWTY